MISMTVTNAMRSVIIILSAKRSHGLRLAVIRRIHIIEYAHYMTLKPPQMTGEHFKYSVNLSDQFNTIECLRMDIMSLDLHHIMK